MKRTFACLLVLLYGTTVLFAEVQAVRSDKKGSPKPPPDKTKEIRLTVRPAAEPRPALKYLLLPELLDRKPGNAATLYFMAMHQSSDKSLSKYNEKVWLWLGKSAKELPRQEAQQMLDAYRTALRQVELAARRDRCDFDLPLSEGYNMPLPSLSKLRHLAKVLAIRISLEIADGEIDNAIHDLQTGFAMARHLGEGVTLIEDLVGIAIAAVMSERVQEVMQAKDAPNLYWALASLPRPMIDIRKAMKYESSWLYLAYPKLRNVASAKLTREQWKVLPDELEKLMAYVRGESQIGGGERLMWTVYAVKLYPEAKRYLLDQGRTQQEVQAMPVAQAIAIFTLEQYDYWRDELFKWSNLPYWQVREGMDKANRRFENWARTKGRMTPAAVLLPSLGRAYFIQARLDRQIASLQTIEAVRMYAADHDGKLPAALKDITEAPAPIDPVLGKPFGYKVEGNTFILEASAPAGMPAKEGRRYIVTLKKRTRIYKESIHAKPNHSDSYYPDTFRRRLRRREVRPHRPRQGNRAVHRRANRCRDARGLFTRGRGGDLGGHHEAAEGDRRLRRQEICGCEAQDEGIGRGLPKGWRQGLVLGYQSRRHSGETSLLCGAASRRG